MASTFRGAISGPPTLVKQDVKVSTLQAVRERQCALLEYDSLFLGDSPVFLFH